MGFGCLTRTKVCSGLRAANYNASAWEFMGKHVGNPKFKWTPESRAAAQGRNSLGERLLGRAGPYPSPPAPPGRQADPVCGCPCSLGPGCFEAWGFTPGWSARAWNTAHSPCCSTASAPHRASAPTAPLGQTPRLKPLRWRKDPLLPPDRAFLLQPARGLLNRRRKTHCDFKQTQRTYRIWRETIFSSAAQSPH